MNVTASSSSTFFECESLSIHNQQTVAIEITIPAMCLTTAGPVTSLHCLVTLRKPSYLFALAFAQSTASWAGIRAGRWAQHCSALHPFVTYALCSLYNAGSAWGCLGRGKSPATVTGKKNPRPLRRNTLQLTMLNNRKHQRKGCGFSFDPASASFQILPGLAAGASLPLGFTDKHLQPDQLFISKDNQRRKSRALLYYPCLIPQLYS